MGMQSKVHPTYKTDRLMAMACLALQRHGRVRWVFSHPPHTVLALVLVCAVGVFAPGVASAQDATIAGTVTDATGGILPGVAVEARDAAGTAQGTVTDGTGQFTFSGLAPGTYDVTFTRPGFTVPAQVVEASAGATAVLDVEMAVGGLAAEVVVVGTRAQPRSVTASSVPIDAIPLQDIVSQGATTLDYQLRTLVPSFNVATHPISDAATLVRPVSLRNLAHDHTLVLVNGKRRHRSSVIAWFAGVTDGAQGPDISTIPSIALRQVEVLRDGASAQYGSDAIAGVMNFLLKDNRSGGSLEFNTGTYRAGDGDAYTIAGNVGLPLGNTGFVNLSMEYGNADPTNRSVQRADAAALIAAGNTAVADPVQIWGNPTIEDDLKLFGNFGHLFANRVQVYGHANYAEKKVTEGFYFRNPNNRANIYSLDDGETLLIGDVLDARDGIVDGSANCPAVRVMNNRPDAVALAQVFADPNCFSFQETIPGGFTPRFGGVVSDMSVVAGVRRLAANGLTWDASASYGAHESDFFFNNTVNASLGPDTPRNFDPGLYRQEEVEPQLRRLPRRQRHRQRCGRRRVARRTVRDRRRGTALLGGGTVRRAGLRLRLEWISRIPRLHRRELEPQQRRVVRRPGAAGSGRRVDRRRRRAFRALRHIRLHDQRQAVGPLWPDGRSFRARRHQHRFSGADPRPAEHAERPDDHRSGNAAAGRQRQRAVDVPGRATAGRPAAGARDVNQHNRRAGRGYRPVHVHRRLLPRRRPTTASRCRKPSRWTTPSAQS